jgi:transcriptional regulator of acetoin/glycerol metabolism
MLTAATGRTPLYSAWERFIRGGRADPALLRPEIRAAWLRCRNAGIDPYAERSAFLLPRAELDQLLRKHQELIDVARPFMGKLYQFVASSLFVVVLCDERGYLMESIGDPEVIREARAINFSRGASWAEEEIGNNGVGTVLFLGRPFQVSGCEHYCLKEHPWTCSGAPILSETGQVIGVLEMSGPVEMTHEHTLGMVVAAAEAIQQQLGVRLRNRELVLLNGQLSNLFTTVSDGLVVVDAAGAIRQVNPAAEKLLEAKAPALTGQPLEAHVDRSGPVRGLLESGLAFADLELAVGPRSGTVDCLASGRPIRDDEGRISSAVIFLNPIHRINKLINRFSGAQAAFTFDDILGTGPALGKALQQAVQAAGSASNVLLCGESGTGKEMLAQAIHNRSARRHGPFIAINCGAIPRELIGSELFGYVEGAFTGAHKRGRPGKFELAAGGTLFLDEIGDMPPDQQVSLLRVLQDKQITRLGGERNQLVDVRIICATNKDLAQEIERGSFRQDLYYRLNVISITLPPLRAHPEDVPMLFRVFQERICARLGLEVAPVDPEVLLRLQRHPWPGNMREFQNVVERMVNAPAQSRLTLGSLPDEILAPVPAREAAPPGAALLSSLRDQRARIKRALAEEERQEILDLMARHRGNLAGTARALGISRTSLYRRLARLQEAVPSESERSRP